MKKIIICTLLLVSILGCSEKVDEINNESVSETFKITTQQSSVKPLELVIISSTEIIFNKESYIGSINDTEINLIKNEDNELVFTVPSGFPIGSAKLELFIDNNKGELTFEIIKNTVQNVDNVISNELITPLSDFENELELLIAVNSYSNYNTVELVEQMESAKKMIADYKTKFNTLSSEEKLEVAKFFNANPIFTTGLSSISKRLSSKNSISGDPNWDCLRDNKAKIVLTVASVVAFVKLIVISGNTPIGPVTAIVGSTAGIYAAVTIASTINENVLVNCFAPIYNSLSDSGVNGKVYSNKTSNFEFDNDNAQSFSVITNVRHVISSDVNNNNEILSTLVSKLNYVKSKFSSIKSRINNTISNATGWFNEWLGTTAKYKQISYEFEELPDTADEYEMDANTEYITIEEFPSDVEVEYVIESDHSISLKFKADEATLPRTVTGKVKYNDGDFSNENEFNVTINKPEDLHPSWMLGHWKLWKSQGFYDANVHDIVDHCFQITYRKVNGIDVEFRYYQEGVSRFNFLADGTVEITEDINGCIDIQGQVDIEKWVVKDNVLEIITAGDYWDIPNAREGQTSYDYYYHHAIGPDADSPHVYLNQWIKQ